MYACIDLGSNSFHLLIGELRDKRIQIIERCSEKVQLGEGVKTSGSISSAAFQRGILCLEHFKQLLDQHAIHQYWALGTNTFRVTDNADSFITSAKNLGIDISIISGVQEAVLIYAGVITGLPVTDAHRLIIDIGGGSTEIIVGKEHRRLLTDSLAIGSVAWRDRFFSAGSVSKQALDQQMNAGVEAARQVFGSVAAGVNKAGWSEAYASSGTVKLLASICQAHGYGERQIKLPALRVLKQILLDCIVAGTDLPGLNERRRDLLLAGWCVMVGLMESYQVETINFSATALREGMLDFMVKNEKTWHTLQESNLPGISYAKN